MLKTFFFLLILLVLSTQLSASNADNDKYKMFPEAQEGYSRYIVDVPKTDDDYAHRVELLIGKNLMVDCNHASFSGKIKSIALKGWGYNYLVVSDLQRGPTTMRACSEPKVEKFITLHDTLRRYNSRLGMVIYVPKGYEVRYRIWSASETIENAIER